MTTTLCDCGVCSKCKRRAWTDKNRERVRAKDRERYYRDYDKRREAQNAHYQRNKGDYISRARKWAETNREKAKAEWTANNAIKRGVLKTQPCELANTGECRGRIEKHHEDYSLPLDVRWLCSAHHGIEHRKYH